MGFLTRAYIGQERLQKGLYGEALKRQEERLGVTSESFTKALEGLQEAAGRYREGGEYTTGQFKQIEEATRQGLAKSRAAAVASGMASGTNLSGMMTSALQRAGVAKAGVEAGRMDRLSAVQQAIANMQAGYGQTMASIQEPQYQSFYSPGFGSYAASLASMEGSALSYSARLQQIESQKDIAEQQMQTQRDIASQKIKAQQEIAEANRPRYHYGS